MKLKRYKKYTAYGFVGFLMIFVLSLAFYLNADDKELFMGSTSTVKVKPNVMCLVDSSASMNTIITYPKFGLDNIPNTADDGYNPNKTYGGSVAGFNSFGTFFRFTEGDKGSLQNNSNIAGWYARWVVKVGSGTSATYEAREYTDASVTGRSGSFSNFRSACTGVTAKCTGITTTGGTVRFTIGSKTPSNMSFSVNDILLYQPYPSSTSSPRNYGAVVKVTGVSGSGGNTLELAYIEGGPITSIDGYFMKSTNTNFVPKAIKMYGLRDVWGTENKGQFEDVRYPVNYLIWAYGYASDSIRKAVNWFADYATFDVTKTPDMTAASQCDQGNGQRIVQRWTRIQVAREVICNVGRTASQLVNLGLMKFEQPDTGVNYFYSGMDDSAGGDVLDSLHDMSDATSLQSFRTGVWGIKGNTWTPLAESLADVWHYYKPGPSGSKTYLPVDYECQYTDFNVSNATSDIQYYCQNNYALVITDGESTMDRFDNYKYSGSIFSPGSGFPVHRSLPWDGWEDGWGDEDYNDKVDGVPQYYNPSTATYCPNNACWLTTGGYRGTDYLDDVAYFMRHQDMFPDTWFPAWPGQQNIYTYVIGFTADNDMLKQTAINGDGAYYTANNYEELVNAFQQVLISINLRNFGFSAITAPKKTATATNEDLTLSYVGYFMPSLAKSIWEGHLLAFKLNDLWGFDVDENGKVGPEEYVYASEEACKGSDAFKESDAWGFDADNNGIVSASEFTYSTELDCYKDSGGKVCKEKNTCQRMVSLDIGQQWDAADLVPETRNLFTHNNSTALINFNLSNASTLQPLFGSTVTADEANQIINTINTKQFGDIFHADVSFVGAPPYAKQYIANLNPKDGGQKYTDFYEQYKNRRKVLFTGTNDGILHMLYADSVDAGTEVWGFIPDEVLPSLKKIVIDSNHTYTVDGRIVPQDIYYVKSGDSLSSWTTLLTFGLRQGGNAYYGLDVSTVSSQPTLLWKFKDDTFSGQSWGKPSVGRIKVSTSSTDPSSYDEKWVVVLPGGFAYNTGYSGDQKGKALFIVDAGTGELLWMIGYDPVNGAADLTSTVDIVETATSDFKRYLTRSSDFNSCIPSAVTVVDLNNDGFIDTIYYGNMAGNMFKTDISNPDKTKWTTLKLYKPTITAKQVTTVSSFDSATGTLTVGNSSGFSVGDSIRVITTGAEGYITSIPNGNKTLIITVQNGTFAANNVIYDMNLDPIYLAPAVAFDQCFQLWVTFGTGNRDRPKSDLNSGRFFGMIDKGVTYTKTDFTNVSFDSFNLVAPVVINNNGFYFDFRSTLSEKLFDPEPIILPDATLIPHVYFDTYQPPTSTVKSGVDPCDIPREGTMSLYDISLTCGPSGTTVSGSREVGRIAGGGVYQGKEYVLYESESGKVADVPGKDGGNFNSTAIKLPYPGGVVFWKEIKR